MITKALTASVGSTVSINGVQVQTGNLDMNRLAEALKTIRRTEDIAGLGVEMRLQVAAIGSSVVAGQRRFVIEQVHLTGAAVLE